jgi:hypothetical protein
MMMIRLKATTSLLAVVERKILIDGCGFSYERLEFNLC